MKSFNGVLQNSNGTWNNTSVT